MENNNNIFLIAFKKSKYLFGKRNKTGMTAIFSWCPLSNVCVSLSRVISHCDHLLSLEPQFMYCYTLRIICGKTFISFMPKAIIHCKVQLQLIFFLEEHIWKACSMTILLDKLSEAFLWSQVNQITGVIGSLHLQQSPFTLKHLSFLSGDVYCTEEHFIIEGMCVCVCVCMAYNCDICLSPLSWTPFALLQSPVSFPPSVFSALFLFPPLSFPLSSPVTFNSYCHKHFNTTTPTNSSGTSHCL